MTGLNKVWKGVSGDGLEGNFWEEGLPPCIQSQLECLHGWSVHNRLWQLVPLRDHSNTERMLEPMGYTPLFVNLESVTSKPSTGGSRKDCVTWKVEKTAHYFAQENVDS